VTALFGPSGSGKTTILRAIAGLERLPGHCALDTAIWQDEVSFVPTHRRALGYVLQEASLFGHLSVRGNLSFGMHDAAAFEQIVDLLKLTPLLERAPEKLSGGERQRVSLGRALLSKPDILLLDEPMSALDRQAKAEIMPYFAALKRALNIPVILVSHDMGEVEQLADHMVLLAGGRVVTSGPLNNVLTDDAAGLWRERDAVSVLAATVTHFDSADQITSLDLGGQTLLVGGRAGEPDEPVRVRIGARDVSLATVRPSQTTILNCLAASITGIEMLDGPDVAVALRVDGQPLTARVTRRSAHALGLAVGQMVYAQVKGVSVLVP
jgi:molybdate transport system ATP-binding protein